MADRTVKVALALDNKGFLANLAATEAAIKKFQGGLGKPFGDPYEPFRAPPKDLPRKGEEAAGSFARGFSKRLEAAFKQLPNIDITADSSGAQIQVAQLRQALQDLSGKTINVDIDAATALGELRAIQDELQSLERDSADIDVRADTGAALAQLRALQQEINRLGGETAQVDVDADTGGAQTKLRTIASEISRLDGRKANIGIDADARSALASIAMVVGALASLPAVATIGLGVGALGAGFLAAGAGAAAFGAVAGPSLGRVNEALKEAESASGGAGGAMKSAAQSAADAASKALSLAGAQDAVRDSAHGVVMAQRGVSDALRGVSDSQYALTQASENAALAADRVSLTQEAGSRRIADAGRAEADAHRATQRALEDLTRAREQAAERIEDLALATEGGALAEQRAEISIKRAKQDLARINAPGSGASQTDKDDAALRLEEAEFGLKRLKESNADLGQEQAKVAKEGVEGSDEVRAASEAVEAAKRRETDASRALGDAQSQAARDNAAAQRDAAAATHSVAMAQRDVRDSQRDVVDAQRAVVEAQQDQLRATQRLKLEQLQQKAALEQVGGAAGGAASKMSELSKEEQKLAKDVKKFNDSYEAWQKNLQPDVFPVIREGMDLLTTGMRIGTPLVKASAGAFGELLDATNKGLQGEEWSSFFWDLNTASPRAIEGLGTATGNVATGLAGIIQAFLPYTGPLMDFLEESTEDFETWGQSLKGSPEFEAFVQYVQTNGPKVGEVLSNLATFVGKIINPAATGGADALDFLVTLSEKLAGMSPEQVEAIAKGVGLLFAAVKLGASLKIGAIVVLAEVLAKMSPGQIQAVALAIAATIAAVKGYQGVTAAIGFWNSIGGSIGKAGNLADGAKGKFGGLAGALKTGGIALALTAVAVGADKISDSLAGLNPDINALARGLGDVSESGKVPQELLDLIGPKSAVLGGNALETFAQSAARLAADDPFNKIGNGVLGFIDSFDIVSLDNGKQAIGELDKTLVTMVSQGNGDKAAQLFRDLAKMAGEAGVPVDKLKQLMPGYTEAVAAAGDASATAAGGIGEAKTNVDGLQKSLDTFAGKTDALQAIRNMETAYKDAATALDASNGKLEVNARMTDAQRNAVITAREKFGGYIQSIRDAADGAATLSGKTTDSTKSVLEQLPKLSDLAGKSSEAKEQILLLAKAYGISEADAKRAMKGGKDLKDVLAELKSKSIKIDLDAKTAQAQLDNLQRTIVDIAKRVALGSVGGLNTSSARGNAWGGIQSSRGRPDYMAQGGVRSLGSNPQPMIATSPQMISGRNGTNVVFAEDGWESFIPLDPSKRPRALEVFGETADILGMAVVPKNIDATSGSTTGGSSSFTGGSSGSLGGTMVTVTGITALQSSLDTTSLNLTSSLTSATDTLDATLGDTGSVTAALQTMTDTLAAQLTKLTSSVDGLAGAVKAAGAAAAAATAAAKSAASSSTKTTSSNSKGSTGSKADEGNPRDSGPGYVAPAGPAKKKSTSKNDASIKPLKNDASIRSFSVPIGPQPGYIAGYANGGLADRPSLFAEDGLEAAVPLSPGKRSRGLEVLGQAAEKLGVSINYSRRSPPTPSAYATSPAAAAASSAASSSAAASAAPVSRPLVIEKYYEAEGGSARQTAEELSYLERRR